MKSRALRWRVVVELQNIYATEAYATEADARAHAKAVRQRYGRFATITVERIR